MSANIDSTKKGRPHFWNARTWKILWLLFQESNMLKLADDWINKFQDKDLLKSHPLWVPLYSVYCRSVVYTCHLWEISYNGGNWLFLRIKCRYNGISSESLYSILIKLLHGKPQPNQNKQKMKPNRTKPRTSKPKLLKLSYKPRLTKTKKNRTKI